MRADVTNRLVSTCVYGESAALCIGVRADHSALLCSILAKATHSVSDAAVSQIVRAHTAYTAQPLTPVGFVYTYPFLTAGLLVALLSIVAVFVLLALRRKRRALQQQQEVETLHREELRHMAERDALTGLFNEQQFLKKTEQLLLSRPERRFVLVRLDISRFQLVNAYLGFQEGDRVLKHLAAEITAYAHANAPCTFGRIARDVFALCCPYGGTADAAAMMETLQDGLKRCNNTFRLMLTFGLYVVTDRDVPAMTMLDRATLAAKSVEGNYATPYAYYTDSMGEAILREQELVNDMPGALEKNQSTIKIQPVYDLQTGKPSGGEALVRWEHPEKGLIAPSAFVPILEKNGLIMKLDAFVWEQACKCLRAWTDAGERLHPISVNVSRVNLYNPCIVAELAGLTARYNVPPQLLQLEVTESAYADNPQVMKRVVTELQEKGFTILMDDFGNGYSSLNILKDIPINLLKIDMQFLSRSEIAGRGENIIASVMRMAKWLGLPVVAEGAEHKEQVEFLRSIGCEYVQGFYFSEPLTPEAYALVMREAVPAKTAATDVLDVNSLWTSDPRVEGLFSGALYAAALYGADADAGQVECLRVNNAFNDLFGYTSSRHVQTQPLDNAVGEYRDTVSTAVKTAIESRSAAQCEYLRRVDNGKNLWIDLKLRYLGEVGGRHLLMAGFFDISAYKEVEQELLHVRSAISGIHATRRTLLIVDDQRVPREITKKIFAPTFDILEAANGQEALDILYAQEEGSVDAILLDMRMPVMDGETFLHVKREDKRIVDIPVIIVTADDSAEKQLNMLAIGAHDYLIKPLVPDVVKRRVNNVIESSNRFRTLLREYRDVVEQAKADPLTRVYNRAAAEQMITDLLQKEDGLLHALVMMDLDNFKEINDTYGHSYGDMVLMEFGTKLTSFFRAGDIVARMGGDEFCVFMRNVRSAYAAQDKCQELCRTVRQFAIGGELVRVTCSVGVAVSTPASTFGELYRQADAALYASKRASKDRVTVFTGSDR